MPIDPAGNTLWATSGTLPYMGARQVAVGATVPAGRGVFIAATAAGTIRLKLADASTLDVPVAVGPTLLDNFAIVGFLAAGTTATAVVSVLS